MFYAEVTLRFEEIKVVFFRPTWLGNLTGFRPRLTAYSEQVGDVVEQGDYYVVINPYKGLGRTVVRINSAPKGHEIEIKSGVR